MTDSLFWTKVRKRRNGCWEYIGCISATGYGRIRRKGFTWQSNRWVWTLINGPIPEGLFVLHKCDNPACVNPGHLFLGNQDDNLKDMKEKGRHCKCDGIDGFNSKLTEDQVLKIRSIGLSMFQHDIAKIFGITKRNVGHILSGFTWVELAKKHNYKAIPKIKGKRRL